MVAVKISFKKVDQEWQGIILSPKSVFIKTASLEEA